MLEHKAVPVNGVEVLDREQGIVSAIVSVTGIVDRVKDVIEPGAYTKTLRNRTPKGVWHHDMTKPVSKTLSIKELMPGDPELPTQLPDGSPWPKEAGALKVLTQFNLKSSRGRDAFADVEFFGADQEWSIGYRVPAGASEMKNGVRHCKEMDLFEYSPVLFGAMPAARTIVSVKEAQEAWGEVKSAVFGTCDDGEGTCCLSCGTKATHEHLEAKADASTERFVVDLGDTAPEGFDSIVGTFGTKAQAEAWAKALTADDPDVVCEVKAAPDGDAAIERFYEAFVGAVLDWADDDDPDDEEKAVGPMTRRPWREHAHRRGANGRFIAKVGKVTRDVAREVARDYVSDVRSQDMPKRWRKASESFERWDRIGQRVERKLADRAGRPPSEAAPRLLGAIFAASHLNPVERRFFKAGHQREGTELPTENDLGFTPADFPTDLEATTKQAAWDWANGDDKKYRRIMRVLPRAIDWLWEEPALFADARLDLRRPRTDPSPYAAKSDDFHEGILSGVHALVEASTALTVEEKSAWSESLHPRSATGEFAPKDSRRQQAHFGGRQRKPEARREVGELTPYQRAQAAVYLADEAHKKKGPEAYARWRRALAALFRGNKPIKPTGKPVDGKDDDMDLEFKRYVSGWDEAKHPRDARGRFTDSPGEAAMKQALQRMQSGAETAAEKLTRLQMDEGDIEVMEMAYFNMEDNHLPVDPNAPRHLAGAPGDFSFEASSPESRAMVDMAVNDALIANLNAQRMAKATDMKPDAAADLAVLSSIAVSAGDMTNPDDRLQMATNFMGGAEIAEAYDSVQADLARPRGNKRKRENARVISEALQVSMIHVFGQGWKERLAPIPGPSRKELHKSARNRRIMDKVMLGTVAAVYGALGAALILGNKADDLESFLAPDPEEDVDPEEEGDVEELEAANEEAEERREAEDQPINNVVVPDEVYDELFSFNTSMVDPDAPPEADAGGLATFLYYVAHPEESPDPEGDAEVAAAEVAAAEGEEPVEEEPEAKNDWEALDAVLDFYFNEPPKSLAEIFDFELDPELEAKADDLDPDYDEAAEDDEFEAFLDDFYGSLMEGTDEEVDAKFDANLHPRDSHGKFTHRGGAVGGAVGRGVRTAVRASSWSSKLIPGRSKIAKRSYSRNQKSAWRRERMAAKLQGRRPSRSLAKFNAAAFAAGRYLPPDERQAYLDDIGVSLNDVRRNIRRDLKTNGSSARRQKRIERAVAATSDVVFRTEKAWEAWNLEIKAAEELAAIDAEIAGWDENHVLDLMAKMSSEELEMLIEGIEAKGAVSEATGGRVADPGKGNQGNIKPIMRWFERGEGAAKIRWGTKGDFMRCVHIAEKHMNPEHARGFCNKRHRAVLGTAPGQGPHLGAPKLKKKDDPNLSDVDYMEFKGARRFLESMVKRASDGKFAPKAGGGRRPNGRQESDPFVWDEWAGRVTEMLGTLADTDELFGSTGKKKPTAEQAADWEAALNNLLRNNSDVRDLFGGPGPIPRPKPGKGNTEEWAKREAERRARIARSYTEWEDEVKKRLNDPRPPSDAWWEETLTRAQALNLDLWAEIEANRRARAAQEATRGKSYFDAEPCILCARPLDAKDVCTGCGTDYLEVKGTRHFLESMVKRANDGKFASKPGRGKLGLTAGAVGMDSKPKKKKSLKRRAVGAAAKGVLRHPGAVAGAGAAGAAAVGGAVAGRASKRNPQAPNKPGTPGALGRAAAGKGPSGSWIDTIDVLADMANDRDSLLNHLVDKGMANVKDGKPFVNINLKDASHGAALTILGKDRLDKLQIRRAAVIAKAVDRFNRPSVADGGEPGPALIPETVIDLDRGMVTMQNDRGDSHEVSFEESADLIAALEAATASRREPESTDAYIKRRAAERGDSEDKVRADLIESRTRAYEKARLTDDQDEVDRTRARLSEVSGVSVADLQKQERQRVADLAKRATPSATAQAESLRDLEQARQRAEQVAQDILTSSAAHKAGKARRAADGGKNTVDRVNRLRGAADRASQRGRDARDDLADMVGENLSKLNDAVDDAAEAAASARSAFAEAKRKASERLGTGPEARAAREQRAKEAWDQSERLKGANHDLAVAESKAKGADLRRQLDVQTRLYGSDEDPNLPGFDAAKKRIEHLRKQIAAHHQEHMKLLSSRPEPRPYKPGRKDGLMVEGIEFKAEVDNGPVVLSRDEVDLLHIAVRRLAL